MSSLWDAHNKSGWPDPQPLTPGLIPMPYPTDALPERIGHAVQEVQSYLQAPIALVSASALSAISLACQPLYDVSRDTALHSPSGLYFASIAEPSERKSACDNLFDSEIRAFQAQHALLATTEKERYETTLDVWQAQYDGICTEIRLKAKKGESIVELNEQLQRHRQIKPRVPRFPHLLYTDVTPEELAFSLANKWPSGGIWTVEGGSFIGSQAMARNSIVKSLALFNTLWDGKRLIVDRRSSGSFVVEGARLSIALMIQEAPLQDFLIRFGSLARGSGFLSRFLISWPESTQGYRPYVEPPENTPFYQAFNQRLREILQLPVYLNPQGGVTPARLVFSLAGKQAWIEFYNTVERELRPGGRFYEIRDCAAKMPENVARMAALFHVFEGREGPIEADLTIRAATICWWHLHEALRFFSSLGLPLELSDASKLDAWLIRICNEKNTCALLKNHVRQSGPLRTTKRIEAALNELAKLDRVKAGRYGRAAVIEVNNKLLDLRW